jgi:hypothetical protein
MVGYLMVCILATLAFVCVSDAIPAILRRQSASHRSLGSPKRAVILGIKRGPENAVKIW